MVSPSIDSERMVSQEEINKFLGRPENAHIRPPPQPMYHQRTFS